MTYTITPLTQQTLEEHLQELMLIDRGTEGEEWLESHFRLELPDKWLCSRLMLDEAGGTVGFIVASLKADTIHIHRFVVRKSQRGQGLGTELLKKVAEYAGHRSISSLRLKVSRRNVRAIKYYLLLGFSESDASADNLELSVNVRSLLSGIETQVGPDAEGVVQGVASS